MNATASPALIAAAQSTRTPADVLKARGIGRCYMIETTWKGGTYFSETTVLLPKGKDQPLDDALSELQQDDDAVAIWELNPSAGTMRNASEQFALLWLDELIRERRDNGFEPDNAATWPQFVCRYVTNDKAAARCENV